jgi:hypothetical protein
MPDGRAPKLGWRERRKEKRLQRALRTGDSPEKQAEPVKRGTQGSAADGTGQASIGSAVNHT